MLTAARVAIVLALVGALSLTAGCSNLSPLSAGICGNGVVDPGEDCDGFAPDGSHEACGAADAGAVACRYECEKNAACPPGYNCGVDQICRSPTGAFVALGSPLAVGAVGVTLADFNGDGYADALSRGDINGEGAARVQVNYLSSGAASLGTFSVADKLSYPSVADVNGDGIADLVAALRIDNASGVSIFLGQPTNALTFQSFPTATIPSAALPSVTATARVIAFSGLPGGPVTAYFMGTHGGTYPPGLYLPTTTGLPDVSAPPEASGMSFVALPEGPDQVVGDVVLAQLGGNANDAGTPCPSLVYETVGGVVRVVSPCAVVGNVVTLAFPPVISTITLPAGTSGCVDAASGKCPPGVQVGDIDGDGSPDLVVSATATNKAAPTIPYGTYVAYGDGNGNFYSSTAKLAGSLGTTSGPYSIKLRAQNGDVIVAPIQIGQTYAVGDVNGDGQADLVSNVTQYATVNGGALAPNVTLLVSAPSLVNGNRTLYSATIGQFSWQTAAIADFNGDGKLDVVGGGASATGINFFSGSTLASGMFVGHEFVVPTTGGVSDFAVGDFDGDGVADLAFGQVDPANDGSVDVSLSYGNPTGPPSSPITIARYASLSQITTAPPYPLIEIVGNPFGAPSSLTVTRFTTGVGGRPPLSSEALTSAQGDAGSTPQVAVAAVAGSFGPATSADGGPLGDALAPLGVAAFGQQAKKTDFLWLLAAIAPPAGAGVLFAPPAVAAGGLPANFDPLPEIGATTNQALLVGAAPLQPSGYASLVAVGSTSAAPARAALLVANASGSPETVSPTNVGSSGAQTLQLSADGGTSYPAIAEDGQLGLSDVDGDGYPDLILLTGTSSSTFCLGIDPLSVPSDPQAPATSTARDLIVFWNDQHGGFSLASPVVVASCEASANCAESAVDCPEAFTTLSATGGAVPTIAYVTHAGVFLARFSPTQARQLLSVTPLTSSVGASMDGGTRDAASYDAGSPVPTTVSDYTGIGAGDINGDGVDDLALAARGSLYFFAGVPVRK
jgi:hypothetical protein